MAQTSPAPEASTTHFQWSRHNAQELSRSNTIQSSSEILPDEKAALIEAVAEQIRPYTSYLQIGSESELYNIAAKTRIELVDLNEDGITEVLAQANDSKAGCGATGNCSFWVFQRSGTTFQKILDSRCKDGVGGIQLFTINPSRMNGFHDIVLADDVSTPESTLRVYRYRDGQYRQTECYKANWISTKDNQLRRLENPELTPCAR